MIQNLRDVQKWFKEEVYIDTSHTLETKKKFQINNLALIARNQEKKNKQNPLKLVEE